MSQNQTRVEKSEGQSRRPGRSNNNHQRGFSGSGGRGGGGFQPPAVTKSYKKVSNGQSRTAPAPSGSTVLNGNNVHSPPHESPESKPQSGGARPVDELGPKNLRAVAKPPPSSQPSQTVGGSSSFAVPSAAPKEYAPKPSVPLQFGSINPGIINGTQIPARTSSAPPNLDEQKRAQAHHTSFTAVPTMPIPSAPKQQSQQQQLTRKNITGIDQPSTVDSHLHAQAREVYVPISSTPSSAPLKSSVLPLGAMPMHMPFQPHQVPIQFGGPNPQLQAHGIPPNSLQMTMTLPVINGPQVPQQMFIPNIQHHPLQAQTMKHQGQGLTFSPQIGHQLPPQLSSMGFGIPPHFVQPQHIKFGGPHKSAVKITHPDTHEELRLDKRTDAHINTNQRQPVPNMIPQSQPIPTFSSAHQMNYYPPLQPNPYNQSPLFYHTSGSQGPRFSSPAGLNEQAAPFVNTSVHNPSIRPVQSPLKQVIIRPAVNPYAEKTVLSSMTIDTSNTSLDAPKLLKLPNAECASHQNKDCSTDQPSKSVEPLVGNLQSVRIEADVNKKEPILSSESMKEYQKETSEKEHSEELNQTDVTDAAAVTKLISDILKDRSDVFYQGGDSENMQSFSQSNSSTCVPSPTQCNAPAESSSPIASQDSSVGDSTSRELATRSAMHERGSLETSTSLGSEMEQIVSGVSDSASYLLKDKLLHDRSSSNASPDSSMTVCSKDLNSGASAQSEETRYASSKQLDASHSLPSDHKAAEFPLPSADASGDGPLNSATNRKAESTACPSDIRQKDKTTLDSSRTKVIYGKRKKRKDILSKADAAQTSDLYNAYNGPEEKQESSTISESIDSSSTVDSKHVHVDDHIDEEAGQSKAELDDWEDASESPNLRTHGNQTTSKKRYSRDFLLTFSEQCIDLPERFEIGSDIVNILMIIPIGSSHGVDYEPHPSPGRATNRSPGASRFDRRAVGLADDDKWTKGASGSVSGQDIRFDMGYGSPNVGFIQGINPAALRNSRAQAYNQFTGGLLPGPMQSLQTQGGIPRSNADAERWQRATGVQRGLIPSPYAPAQVMHKAAKKYEIGKVTDIEEAKQRQLKAILNKLTPQNFEKLFLQVKEVNIDNTVTLSGVISQIFDKALMEPTFCEMYANFCAHLSNELPDFFSEDNEKINFKRLLLNKCQEEFERNEREEAEANRAEEEGEVKQTDEQREEKRVQARRRMLGNIRLIGELYKKRMLTERIMHECIKKLLGEYQNPDEEDIEALCKLMSTIGDMIDHSKARVHMDAYFGRMSELSTNQTLSSRVRFMLRDAIDLRKNNWQQRRKVEGPKKIDEVHRDAAQERQAQSSRLARGPVSGSAQRRGPPGDYSARGSPVLSSPSYQQVGGARGSPSQGRGYAAQDARRDERHHFESRVLSVPPRTIDESSISLGPQGGLAKDMSIRGQPLMSNIPSTDYPMNIGGSHRFVQDKFSVVSYDQRSTQNHDGSFGSKDSPFGDLVIDRSSASTHPGRIRGSSGEMLHEHDDAKPQSEDTLREKSISAIKEFYSAKDAEEVALCIKELNAPNFYPSIISLWITDSFERKETERTLLAKLIINLYKSQDKLFNETHLIQGFKHVLSSLEDAVNDAPKAAEFLGQIFAKVTLEGLVPFREIERLTYEGGDEPGSLRDTGLASEVLGSILEFIRTEKGDSVIKEMRGSSSLRLEDFLPPNFTKTNKLHAFL